MRGSRTRTSVVLLLLLAGSAIPAQAHTVFSTSGPFVAGVKHFFISFDDLLTAFGIGLLMGLRDQPLGGKPFWAMPLTWALLGGAGILLGGEIPHSLAVSAVTLIALGILVALDWKSTDNARTLLVIALAAVHGFLNGQGIRELGPVDAGWQLLGIVLGAYLMMLYPAAVMDTVKKPWMPIVARVLGSWIAAIGLLTVGWTFRAMR